MFILIVNQHEMDIFQYIKNTWNKLFLATSGIKSYADGAKAKFKGKLTWLCRHK